MKQALSPEVPARVRRGQFRAITLGIGASALAMACSFGSVGEDPDIRDVDAPTTGDGNVEDPNNEPTPEPGNGGGGTVDPPTDTPDAPTGTVTETYDPNDPFSSEEGKIVADILELNCGGCHIGPGSQGDFGYLKDIDQLITSNKVVPGNKEDSQLYNRMVGGTMPPAARRVIQTPTYSQIELIGKWIDELEIEDPNECVSDIAFKSVDQQIELMAQDISRLDPVTEAPFTRYLTITYSSNTGDCGRALDRQRYGLFKGINSVSTGTQPVQPEAIDEDETIYRIDIRDFDWDREIDLEDNDSVDFTDGWEAIIADARTSDFIIEYEGDQADDLKADAQTLVPFLPVNVFIQATEFGDLYYTLINGRANLFDFEREVMLIDTVEEIAENNLMRAGFENSGVSKQERVLNRFDSGIAAGQNYWISFDFDGGNGGDGAAGFERDVSNESIFADPLGFAFAGGEAIFSLPNGLQGYYVAAADGTRLATAPIGVVIDPAQNNGLVTNGASCHSCHNAGMITFTDTVRQFVVDNRVQFDNETYEDVLEQYPDQETFNDQMDRDSATHIRAAEAAGVPEGVPDPISRIYLDFQLGNVTAKTAAGELGVTEEFLLRNLNLLDPRLANLDGDYIDRNIFADTFLDAVCILQGTQDNTPVGCP